MINFFKNINKKIKQTKFVKRQKKKIQEPGSLFNAFFNSKTIFIHIPKTAGISIIKSIYGDVSFGGHRSMYFYSKIFDLNKEKYFSFCFVRNPFDRLYSSYMFLKKGGINQHDKKAFLIYMDPYNDFEDFVLNGLNQEMIYEVTHLIPQFEFVCDKNQKILVDFCGKFEDLDQNILLLSEKLNKKIVLEHHNTNLKDKIYSEVYTPKMIEKVKEIYQLDINIFGYNLK